jgi:hypothetical protein
LQISAQNINKLPLSKIISSISKRLAQIDRRKQSVDENKTILCCTWNGHRCEKFNKLINELENSTKQLRNDKCVCCSDELFCYFRSCNFVSSATFKKRQLNAKVKLREKCQPFLQKTFSIPFRRSFFFVLNKATVRLFILCLFSLDNSYPRNNENLPSKKVKKVEKREKWNVTQTSRHYVSFSSNSNLMNLIVFTFLRKNKVLLQAAPHIFSRACVGNEKNDKNSFNSQSQGCHFLGVFNGFFIWKNS